MSHLYASETLDARRRAAARHGGACYGRGDGHGVGGEGGKHGHRSCPHCSAHADVVSNDGLKQTRKRMEEEEERNGENDLNEDADAIQDGDSLARLRRSARGG